VRSELWRDLEAAFICLTPVGLFAAPPGRERLARAMLFFPVVGVAIGVTVAASALALAGAVSQLTLGIVCVLAMAALSRGVGLGGVAAVVAARRARPAGEGRMTWVVIVLALLAGKTTVLAATAESLVTHALVLAAVLGRWAPVVLAHGARPVRAAASDPLAVGRVGTREFAWASVVAIGASLAVAEALGLVAVVVAATASTGLRLWAYRGQERLSAAALAAAMEVVEIAVLAALAGVSVVALH
jgi:cobalamin synthase